MPLPPHCVRVVAIAGLSAALGCGPGGEPVAALRDGDLQGVIAVFDGGRICAAAVDLAVLALPPDQRLPEDGDFAAWHAGIVRRLALQRIVTDDALSSGLDREVDLVAWRTELQRQVVTALYAERHLPVVEGPDRGELRTYYERHVDRLRRREQRLVYHIFRRLPPQGDRSGLLHELGELRAQIMAGASFTQLAAERSESESRHRQGLLGWIERGDLQPEVDQIVFELEVGAVSQPVPAAGGAHLFLVREAVADETLAFADIEPVLRRQLLAQRRETTLMARVGKELPADSFVPGPEDLLRILSADDPATVVLRIGGFTLRLDALERRLAAVRYHTGLHVAPRSLLMSSILRRELIYQYCVRSGFVAEPEVADRLAKRVAAAMEQAFLRRRLLAEITAEEDRLRAYHRLHQKRFSEPLRLRLRRLSLPLNSEANARMATLEARHPELDHGATALEQLAAELGGELEELGWLTLQELSASSPRAAQAALELEPGSYSPPFRSESRLELIQLQERREPVPLPFREVRDRVAEDYLLHRGQEVYARLESRLLAGAGFELIERSLDVLTAPAEAGAAYGEEGKPCRPTRESRDTASDPVGR